MLDTAGVSCNVGRVFFTIRLNASAFPYLSEVGHNYRPGWPAAKGECRTTYYGPPFEPGDHIRGFNLANPGDPKWMPEIGVVLETEHGVFLSPEISGAAASGWFVWYEKAAP